MLSNNKRKMCGIPLRRKHIKNRGKYRKWIERTVNEIIARMGAQIIASRPYPYHFNNIEEPKEFKGIRNIDYNKKYLSAIEEYNKSIWFRILDWKY